MSLLYCVPHYSFLLLHLLDTFLATAHNFVERLDWLVPIVAVEFPAYESADRLAGEHRGSFEKLLESSPKYADLSVTTAMCATRR